METSWSGDLPLEWLHEWNRDVFRGMFGTMLIVSSFFFYFTVTEPFNYGFMTGSFLVAFIGIASTAVRPYPHIAEAMQLFAMTSVMALGYGHILFVDDIFRRMRVIGTCTTLFYLFVCLSAFRPVARVVTIAFGMVCGIATVFLVNLKYGDPWSIVHLSVFPFYAVVFGTVATVFQHRLIAVYMAQQELASENKTMEDLLSMTYDCTMWLGIDGNTILRSDLVLETELMKPNLEGSMFIEACFAKQDAEEHARVCAAIERARKVPVVLPTTFAAISGRHVGVNMIIVRRHAVSEGNSATPFFLVGVSFDKARLAEGEFEEASSMVGSFQLRVDQPMIEPVERGPSTSASDVDIECLAIAVGKGDDTEVRRKLLNFTETGIRDHWLIPCSDLQLRTNCILGVGGFGLVLHACLHGTSVAVKVSRDPPQIRGAQGLISLLHEIRMMRHVSHLNLVQFHGAIIDIENAEVGLVFELLYGKSIKDFAHDVPATALNVCDRLRVAVHVIRALRYLHAQKPPIVHMDVKASNVLVEKRGCLPLAKLIDFGLSRLVTRRSVVGGCTFNWAAPEVICSPCSRPTPASDVFSFGCVLFFLMTGREPLASFSREAIVGFAFAGGFPPLDWPDGYIPFCERISSMCSLYCLYDASRRPGTIRVHDEIQRLLSASLRELPRQSHGGAACGSSDVDSDEGEENGQSEDGPLLSLSEGVSKARKSLEDPKSLHVNLPRRKGATMPSCGTGSGKYSL